MSTILTVHHSTVYRYARPVSFSEHRLMFRPRDSHDMRLIDTGLTIVPHATVRWMHDVFGNSIAIASFDTPADELRFESLITVEHFGISDSDFPIAPYARSLPFAYAGDELPDLGRTVERHYPDPAHEVDAWAKQFLSTKGPTDTNELLIKMTQSIKDQFAYVERREEGVQTPVQTLGLGSGSCRDLAVLMMEAVRSLGMAARFVSGYLYDSALDGAQRKIVGAGSTHAWVQVYLPGAGWLEFDPTNGLVGGPNLIRVAVARDPAQAVPLMGTYVGTQGDFLGMTVEVTVTARPSEFRMPVGLAS